MFMTPALTNSQRDNDSSFGGLMHLNALNGSTSINSQSGFGRRNYVNDEHTSSAFFENCKYYSSEILKSPVVGSFRATSPLPSVSGSRVKSPRPPRQTGRVRKYEAEVHSSRDETTERNLLKNNFTRNKLEVKNCQCNMDQEVKAKRRGNSSDSKMMKSLNFDSLSLNASPRKENCNSLRWKNKMYR